MAKNQPAELEIALKAAQLAGAETLKWFRDADLSVETKADGSPVTVADKSAEELARKILSKECPNDGIWGEEFGQEEGNSGKVWVIDPIDGTKSFISGIPTYSTLLAYGKPELNEWDLGVIYIPSLDETLYAYNGGGCWFVAGDGSPPVRAQTSQTKKLEQATVVASGADYVPENIMQTANIFRTWGDGYGYLLLATGRVDAMLDIDLSVWDYAPMQVIVSEAGGEILNWQNPPKVGNPENLNQVATNGALSDDLRKYLELTST